MTRDGYRSRRGTGLDGLLDAIRRSEPRHPPLDDGGVDPDHCDLCEQVFHEHRQESARWRRNREAEHDPDWAGWEARLRSLARARRGSNIE